MQLISWVVLSAICRCWYQEFHFLVSQSNIGMPSTEYLSIRCRSVVPNLFLPSPTVVISVRSIPPPMRKPFWLQPNIFPVSEQWYEEFLKEFRRGRFCVPNYGLTESAKIWHIDASIFLISFVVADSGYRIPALQNPKDQAHRCVDIFDHCSVASRHFFRPSPCAAAISPTAVDGEHFHSLL